MAVAIYDPERDRKDRIKSFSNKMARGRLIREQCDRIRKMKDNAVNENVKEFIDDIETYLYAVREPDIVSLLCKLDIANLDKGKKVNVEVLKNSSLVSCYSFSTVDAYTISFECWKLNININRRSSTVTKINYL